jgi:hypothetical protein
MSILSSVPAVGLTHPHIQLSFGSFTCSSPHLHDVAGTITSLPLIPQSKKILKMTHVKDGNILFYNTNKRSNNSDTGKDCD